HSRTREEHIEQVHKVLEKLEEANLIVAPQKCVWMTQRVEYLGFVIEPGIIRPDLEKVKAVEDWPTPRTVREVRSFIGFTNFYRTLIKGYGGIAAPLTKLTRKEVPYVWDRA